MIKHAIFTGHLAKLHAKTSPSSIFRASKSVTDFQAMGDRRWYHFSWTPPSSLAGGLTTDQADQTSYPFILRESSDRFILLSTHQTLVQAFFKACKMESYIEYPRVNVTELVRRVSYHHDTQGRPYRLGTVFAAVDGFGRALKTIAFWGDDIGDTALFQDLESKLSPFRAALRDTRSDREIASIGSGGEVSFFYRGLGHLDQTDRLFKYLTHLNLISWDTKSE